ncbi:tetratricopeptide repeat protein, partial [Streptomyces sp. WAC06614]|uniref:tetratricopeptide repeat protein n=1 Tax=Streptomyces sp. WAC06614 TaxID=2487416 RepID=UPI0021B00B1D
TTRAPHATTLPTEAPPPGPAPDEGGAFAGAGGHGPGAGPAHGLAGASGPAEGAPYGLDGAARGGMSAPATHVAGAHLPGPRHAPEPAVRVAAAAAQQFPAGTGAAAGRASGAPVPSPPAPAAGPAGRPTAAGAAVPAPVPGAAVPAVAAGVGQGPGSDGVVVGLGVLDVRGTALALPVPLVDPGDPNAAFLAGLSASAPGDLLSALPAAPADTPELRLREVRARLELGEPEPALAALAGLEARDPDDWRVVWARGIASLATGDDETAALSFDAVYDAFPGEPAPKLALALCAEILGQLDNAAEYYGLVWTTDPGFVSAAFGLARVQLATGDRAGAVRTLESVPESSIHCTAARVAAVRARLRERSPQEALLPDLTAAAAQVAALERFGLDAERHERLRTEVLGTALDWVLSGSRGADPGRTSLLGSQLDERGLRFGLERSYRVLARLAQRGEERIELVERANRFRPRTWV